MMKKLTLCLVLTIAAAAFAAAQDSLEVYETRYSAAQTKAAQLDVLKGMGGVSGAGEFYAKSLRQLLSDYRNISLRNVTERKAAEDQVILLSARLGTEKYSAAADDLWKTVEGFSEPLVKAEALVALGKIGATQYLPQVIRTLETLNLAPTANRSDGERIAFGAIRSLEEYKDPSGYLPVFFASIGWYSDRIKNQAIRSFTVIADDPYPYMMPIVKETSYNFPTKYSALQNMEASKADNAKKVEVAVAALTEGWRNPTDDLELMKILSNMRKLAITMIGKYKTDDTSIYPLLARSYANGYDIRERLDSISALGALGTEESAQQLTNFLIDLNTKRRTGNIVRENETMVRAIIPAIGQTGRASAIPTLTAVGDAGWPPAVKTLADDTLKQLNK